jgi:two-component system, NarL family, response regulator DevR
VFASIMAGAADYVLKQIRGDELTQAIRTVGRGRSLLDPAVAPPASWTACARASTC